MALELTLPRADFLHGLIVGEELGYVDVIEHPPVGELRRPVHGQVLALADGAAWAWRLTGAGVELLERVMDDLGMAGPPPEDAVYGLMVALARLAFSNGAEKGVVDADVVEALASMLVRPGA